MNRLIARAWHLMRGSLQWRVLWLAHAKFMIGVTGIVRDHDGQVLLLRHRMWPEGRQWGLPTGYAKAGESFPDTITREVREETGLTVTAGGWHTCAAATTSGSKWPTRPCIPEASSSSAHWKYSTPAGSPPTRSRPASSTPTSPSSGGNQPANHGGQMTALLAPNERLAGTPEQRRDLTARLDAIRAAPSLHPMHPELSLIRLADLMTAPSEYLDLDLDLDLLRAGIRITEHRYRQHGLTRLLPPERTWIGIASGDPTAFGGFHYPGQGYRHWQMAAVITRYGNLADPAAPDPRLATLDLLRAYAHDSLHYGSHRLYQQHPAGTGIARTQYGINFRRDGRTYSRPDQPGAASTRNLGIIMEAATDREARANHPAGRQQRRHHRASRRPDRAEYRDATGLLTAADIRRRLTATPGDRQANPCAFLVRMARYQHAVGSPYTAFLTELSPDVPSDLHAFILTAMITGSLSQLSRTLNQHHGPAAFTRIFKTQAFSRSEQPAA